MTPQVAYLQGEGNTNDSLGINDGALMNRATFAGGKVGQAFRFDGVDDYVEIADSDTSDITQAVSIGTWPNCDRQYSASLIRS